MQGTSCRCSWVRERLFRIWLLCHGLLLAKATARPVRSERAANTQTAEACSMTNLCHSTVSMALEMLKNPQRRRPRAEGPVHTFVRSGHLWRHQVNHEHQAVLHGVPHLFGCAPHDRDPEHLLAFQRGNVKTRASVPGASCRRTRTWLATPPHLTIDCSTRATQHKVPDGPWPWLQEESCVLHLILHEGHWLIRLKLGASRDACNVASISLQLWLGPLIWPSSLHSSCS